MGLSSSSTIGNARTGEAGGKISSSAGLLDERDVFGEIFAGRVVIFTDISQSRDIHRYFPGSDGCGGRVDRAVGGQLLHRGPLPLCSICIIVALWHLCVNKYQLMQRLDFPPWKLNCRIIMVGLEA